MTSTVNRLLTIPLKTCFVLLTIVVIHWTVRNIITGPTELVKRPWPTYGGVDETWLFSFVPPNLKYCDNLFKHINDSQEGFPRQYNTIKKQLDSKYKEIQKRLHLDKKYTEGHSGQKLKQSLAYYSLAKSDFVKTICETGFNAGHSALLWLSTKKNITVYSFDLGSHKYSRPMAAFLQAKFPGMLNVTWGDSKVTIPKLTARNQHLNCDIISVDGGHNYVEANADLRNLRTHAKRKYHLLLLDDYPAIGLPGVKKAWLGELRAGLVMEHFHCKFRKINGGFTVGKYLDL